MQGIEKIEEVKSLVESVNSNAIRLYFVYRILKNGITKNKKMLNKHTFSCERVDLTPELQKYFYNLLISQLSQTLDQPDICISDYAVVDDDLEGKVYTYALNNAKAFQHVILEELSKGTSLPACKSLNSAKENLWAYSLALEDPNISVPLYFFRKLRKSSVATPKNKGLIAYLNLKEEKLSVLESDSISFDEKIDCFYYSDNFFVLYKKGFEEVVGLIEEFSEAAEGVIKEIEESGLVDGWLVVLEESKTSIRTLRKLASLAKNGNHKEFNAARLDRIESISKRFNLNLKVKDGKIVVKDSKDVDLLIKILDKYFVECMQTGDAYGSFAKVKLDAQTI